MRRYLHPEAAQVVQREQRVKTEETIQPKRAVAHWETVIDKLFYVQAKDLSIILEQALD